MYYMMFGMALWVAYAFLQLYNGEDDAARSLLAANAIQN